MKRIETILKFVLNSLQFHTLKANSNIFLQSIQSPEGCEERSLLDSSSVIEIAMAIVEAAMEIIWPGSSAPVKYIYVYINKEKLKS